MYIRTPIPTYGWPSNGLPRCVQHCHLSDPKRCYNHTSIAKLQSGWVYGHRGADGPIWHNDVQMVILTR